MLLNVAHCSRDSRVFDGKHIAALATDNAMWRNEYGLCLVVDFLIHQAMQL